MTAPLLSWETYEAEYTPKPASWYIALTIITVGSALSSLIAGNILFALILLCAGICIALVAGRKSVRHKVELREEGIVVGGIFHPYQNILSFALSKRNDREYFLFRVNVGLVPVHMIPLEHTPGERVEAILKSKKIERADTLDSLSLRVADWVGLA